MYKIGDIIKFIPNGAIFTIKSIDNTTGKYIILSTKGTELAIIPNDLLNQFKLVVTTNDDKTVVNMLDRQKTAINHENKKTVKSNNDFKATMQANQNKQAKLAKKRLDDNKSVLRSYRIKND